MAKTVLEHLEKDTLIQEYWVPQHDEYEQSNRFRNNNSHQTAKSSSVAGSAGSDNPPRIRWRFTTSTRTLR